MTNEERRQLAAASEWMHGYQSQTSVELTRACDEIDALMAYIEEGKKILSADNHTGNLYQWAQRSPADSLIHLKAEWQAEAMEGWVEQVRFTEGLNTYDIVESAHEYAEELRRQAEESPQ